MSKKSKSKVKYYAIKEGKEVKDKIVTSWEECSKLVLGYNAVYKSFSTLEEANRYLNIVDVEKVKEQTKIGMQKKKERRATTKAVSTRIDNDLYEKFYLKCEEFEMKKDEVIKMLIEEWVI